MVIINGKIQTNTKVQFAINLLSIKRVTTNTHTKKSTLNFYTLGFNRFQIFSHHNFDNNTTKKKNTHKERDGS